MMGGTKRFSQPLCIQYTNTKFISTKYKRGVDLISNMLPFGRLWYGGPDAISSAIGCAEHRSRSHDNLGNNEIVFAERNLKLIFSQLARRSSSRLYVLCR